MTSGTYKLADGTVAKVTVTDGGSILIRHADGRTSVVRGMGW